MAPKRCEGSAALRWATKSQELAAAGVADGGGHCRQLSGDIVWCSLCGAYAAGVARGMAQPCPGRRQAWRGGGRHGQLLSLRAGKHPRTGAWLGMPIPEISWEAGDGMSTQEKSTEAMRNETETDDTADRRAAWGSAADAEARAQGNARRSERGGGGLRRQQRERRLHRSQPPMAGIRPLLIVMTPLKVMVMNVLAVICGPSMAEKTRRRTSGCLEADGARVPRTQGGWHRRRREWLPCAGASRTSVVRRMLFTLITVPRARPRRRTTLEMRLAR